MLELTTEALDKDGKTVMLTSLQRKDTWQIADEIAKILACPHTKERGITEHRFTVTAVKE